MYGTQRIEEAVTPFLYSGVETPGADGCDDNGDAAARKRVPPLLVEPSESTCRGWDVVRWT